MKSFQAEDELLTALSALSSDVASLDELKALNGKAVEAYNLLPRRLVESERAGYATPDNFQLKMNTALNAIRSSRAVWTERNNREVPLQAGQDGPRSDHLVLWTKGRTRAHLDELRRASD